MTGAWRARFSNSGSIFSWHSCGSTPEDKFMESIWTWYLPALASAIVSLVPPSVMWKKFTVVVFELYNCSHFELAWIIKLKLIIVKSLLIIVFVWFVRWVDFCSVFFLLIHVFEREWNNQYNLHWKILL